MNDSARPPSPDFSGIPSRPRARRALRLLVYILLLLLACGSIWFIDRGVSLSNSPAPPVQPAK